MKAILRESVDITRIFLRDTQSYCGIILDDNNRKPVCRFYFSENKLRIGLFDSSKKEVKHDINSLDDIFKFSKELKETITYY